MNKAHAHAVEQAQACELLVASAGRACVAAISAVHSLLPLGSNAGLTSTHATDLRMSTERRAKQREKKSEEYNSAGEGAYAREVAVAGSAARGLAELGPVVHAERGSGSADTFFHRLASNLAAGMTHSLVLLLVVLYE